MLAIFATSRLGMQMRCNSRMLCAIKDNGELTEKSDELDSKVFPAARLPSTLLRNSTHDAPGLALTEPAAKLRAHLNCLITSLELAHYFVDGPPDHPQPSSTAVVDQYCTTMSELIRQRSLGTEGHTYGIIGYSLAKLICDIWTM